MRNNPSESNYRIWEKRIEASGHGFAWGPIILVCGLVAVFLIVIIANSKKSSKSDNSSSPEQSSSKPYIPANQKSSQPVVKEEVTPATEEPVEEEEETAPSAFNPDESQSQSSQEEIAIQPAQPVGSSRIIRVSTNQILPRGTRLQVLIYDNNGNEPREAKYVHANFNNYQLEIELEEAIPDGTRFRVNWFPPHTVQQPLVYVPQRPQMYIPQQPRMHRRHQ